MKTMQRFALVAGIVGIIAALIGAAMNITEFFHAYLFAYVFWFGLSIGSLALAMLHDLAGGRWGALLVRFWESAASTLPLMLVLFIPIVAGIRFIYSWANDAQALAAQSQAAYLNIPFFVARAGIYFAIWILLTHFVRRWSLERDRSAYPARLTFKLRRISALGLVLFVITGTFASIDWVMSLEPRWSSTVYGAMVLMSAVLSAFALSIVLRVGLLNRIAPADAGLFNDLGSLMLAFVMIWAYLALSQLLIIYAGNLSHEIPWYVNRLNGGWEWIALAVALLQFALPFAFLLFRDLKRHAGLLAFVAGILVFAHVIDVWWLVQPAFSPGALSIHWLHLVSWLGIGGVWLAMMARTLARHPLLPVIDRHGAEPVSREIIAEQKS